MRRCLLAIILLVLLVLALFAVHTPAEAQDSDDAIVAEVDASVRAYRAANGKYNVGAGKLVITIMKRDMLWAWVIVGVPVQHGHGAPDSHLVVVHRTSSSGSWAAAVEGTIAYTNLVNAAPSTIISSNEKSIILSFQGQGDVPPPGNGSSQLSLPWATGETWTFSGGPHVDGFPSGTSGAWSALDFAGGSGSIRAMREGTAYVPCANYVRIDHAGGWRTAYYHVANIAIGNGQGVSRGTHLGQISTQTGCGGSAFGAHVHVALWKDGNHVNVHGHDIGGYTVLNGSAPYQGCLQRVSTGQQLCVGSGIFNDGSIGSGDGNLLQNGNFNTTAHPWSVTLNQMQCAWTRYNVGRDGSAALSMHRPSSDRCLSFWQDVPLTLNVGQTVTATIWGRRGWDGEMRRGRFAIWGLGTDQRAVWKNFQLGANWQCLTVSYTETIRTRTTLRFEIYVDSVGHPDYQFDDASLVVGTSTPCDTTPPNASITSPAADALINSNNLTITASATDSVEGVAEVVFYRLNGSNWVNLGNDTTAPYQLTTDVSSLSDGNHTFAIRAMDNSGNWTNYVSRTVVLDRTPPTGIMVAPAPDSQTSAKRITLRANAADATSGVARVEYLAWSPEPWSNEQWIHIGTVYDPPYEFTWSIPHVNWYAFLMARIVDRAGNVRETFGNGNWTWFSVNLRPDTIGIFRPSQAAFYLRNQNTTGVADIAAALGISTDIPVVGDWDGDGIDSIGVYRRSTGQFFLKNANTTGAPIVYQLALGIPNDVPISGDWDGDGRDSVGVFRPSNGLIYLRNALTTGFADFTMVFGIPNDRPVAGDWNGNGRDTIGVYRNGVFYLTNTTCNCAPTAHYQFGLGIPGDVPFAGDWDRNGTDGVGVFRPTNGITYFKNALTTGFADLGIVYGIAGDFPVAGVWTHAAGDQPPAQIDVTPSETAQPEVAPTFVPRQ